MATKIYKIETDDLKEGLDKIKEIILEENKECEEKNDCDTCEMKDECDVNIAKFKGKDFLNAIFNLLLVQIKEEYHDELREQYKGLFEEDYSWIIGDILREDCISTIYKLFELLNNKKLREQLRDSYKKDWVDKHNKRKC